MLSKVVAPGLVAFTAIANGLDQYVSDDELEHFRLLNELRAEGFTCPYGTHYQANAEPLLFDCRLWRAAKLHSEDMVANGYYSHYSQDGSSPWDRSAAQGIAASGENILWTYTSMGGPDGALDGWQGSDGHCNNMMNPAKRLFGVGMTLKNGIKEYWVQMFAGENWIESRDESCIPPEGYTRQPTAKPTAGPPTAKPTPAPTHVTPAPSPHALMMLCKPKDDCMTDGACLETNLPLCATFGTHNCGYADELTGIAGTGDCVMEQVAVDETTSFCGPHPSDAAATWDDCYRTFHMTVEQCEAQGDTAGVSCVWITGTYSAFSTLLGSIFG